MVGILVQQWTTVTYCNDTIELHNTSARELARFRLLKTTTPWLYHSQPVTKCHLYYTTFEREFYESSPWIHVITSPTRIIRNCCIWISRSCCIRIRWRFCIRMLWLIVLLILWNPNRTQNSQNHNQNSNLNRTRHQKHVQNIPDSLDTIDPIPPASTPVHTPDHCVHHRTAQNFLNH